MTYKTFSENNDKYIYKNSSQTYFLVGRGVGEAVGSKVGGFEGGVVGDEVG